MYVNAPGCSPNAVTGDIGHLIMTQCFAFPAPGVLGNYGRNMVRVPTFRDLDFSVFKNQNLWGEKLKAQVPGGDVQYPEQYQSPGQFAGHFRRQWQASLVLSENLTRGPFHAAFRNTTNSVLVTAIR